MGTANSKVMKTNVERKVQKATYSPVMEALTRIGYGVRGLIYIMVGLLAAQFAFGKGGALSSPQGVIAVLGKQPAGSILLWVILIGVISYSIWGLIRAVFDPLHKGNDMKGLLTRVGFVASALSYAALAYVTYGYIKGRSQSANGSQKLIASIMAMPMGSWIVGILGLIVLGVGLYQIYLGFTSGFDRQFQTYALSPKEIKMTTQIGRFGTSARGVVFAIVGILISLAAYQANPGQPIGVDAALATLLDQPYGIWLLGIVAAGLMAFGFYSMLSAAWFRLKR